MEYNASSWLNGARPYRCRWDTSTILTPIHRAVFARRRNHDGTVSTETYWWCDSCDGPLPHMWEQNRLEQQGE